MNNLRLARLPEHEIEIPTPPVWTQKEEDQRLRLLAMKMAQAGSPFVRRTIKFNPDVSLRTLNGYAPAVTTAIRPPSLTTKILRLVLGK